MSGKSYDAPQVAPSRGIFDDEERLPSSRPDDGGSGAPGFVRQVEAATNELRTMDRSAALGPGETASGDSSFWDRSIHASE